MKQKDQFAVIETHLRREEEFREKVFNRETNEVMKLIEEYESLTRIYDQKPHKIYRYSELMPDL